jgi:DNA-binding transcriptional LysR family regulator
MQYFTDVNNEKYSRIATCRNAYLIVKHGSFRQAAKELNISPPTLTIAINNLEEKLGTRL